VSGAVSGHGWEHADGGLEDWWADSVRPGLGRVQCVPCCDMCGVCVVRSVLHNFVDVFDRVLR
jgi:hypothetical protein